MFRKSWPKVIAYLGALLVLLAGTIFGWQALLGEQSSNIQTQVNHAREAFNFTVKNKLDADAAPIQSHRPFGEFISTMIRSNDFFKPIFNAALFQQMNVTVSEKQQVVFSHKPHGNIGGSYTSMGSLQVGDLSFMVTMVPSAEYVANRTNALPMIFLIIGLLVCCLMAVIFYLFLLAQKRLEVMRKHSESLNLIYQCTQAIADSTTVGEALGKLITKLCQSMRWSVGHAFIKSLDNEVLVTSGLLFVSGKDKSIYRDFIALTSKLSFKKGIGLPGRVWERREPVWVDDIHKDTNFPRGKFCRKIDLHNAFSFPIFDDKGDLAFTLEFFSPDRARRDDDFLALVKVLSIHVGHTLCRLKSEEKIQINETKYRNVVENAVDTIIMIDGHGIICECNPASLDSLGYMPEELVGVNVTCLMSKSNAEKHDQYLQGYLNTGVRHIIGMGREVEAIHKEGHSIVLWLSVSEIKLQGKTFFIGMLRDISKQKRYEKSLKESQEQTALLLNSADEGIYGLDLKGRTTFINPSALAMLGYKEDEVLGQPMHALIHYKYSDGRPYPEKKCPVYAAFSDGELHRVVDEVFWRKDGVSFPVEYTATPMRHGEILQGAVVIFNDITEGKKQREAIDFNHALMDKLLTMQADYLAGVASADLFAQALNILLDLTQSQSGFIGEVIDVKLGAPYLRILSMDHIDWDPSRKLDCSQQIKQGLECHDADTLIGKMLKTGRKMIVDSPIQPLTEIDLPLDQSGVSSYLGLPIFGKDGFIGVIVLLNTMLAFSYNDEIIERISPIVHALSSMMDADAASKKLEQMAHHDELTGLYNRAFFNEYLDKTLALAKRQGSFFALIYLDIDEFKGINDSLGHPVGDALLQEVAQRLLSVSRASDLLARLGGDEFILIVTNTHSIREVGYFADKIVGLALQPYCIGAAKLHVTTSVGIACFPAAGDNAAVLFKNADIALYKAKAAGKNQYQFFSEAAIQAKNREEKIQQGLLGAIKRQEFFLVYQPQWDLLEKRIVGMEALIRWKSDLLGIVLPEEFIGRLEAGNEIHEVGLWVLTTAFQQFAEVSSKLPDHFKLAINLSAKQFQHPQLATTIDKLMQLHHVNPAKIEFEVTETGVMNAGLAASILTKLREMGASISIDDFGTGYSSLSRLQDLPLDILKIDKSFVLSLSEKKESRLIIENTLQLAKKLKLKVIAEGIETEQQLQFLVKHGCKFGQGFYLGKPMFLQAIVRCMQNMK